jgi:hypothetical protein
LYVRVVRGLRPDRNPLRRASDRRQVYLLAGLFVAAAAGAPFAAQTAASAAYAGALGYQHAQLAATHEVRAILTQAAGGVVDGNVVTPEVPVQATWTSVTGVKRTGQVLAPAGSEADSPLTIWTDAAGNVASAPLDSSDIAGQSDTAAFGAVVGVGLVYLCGAVMIRRAFHRRRMTAWEAEWTVTARTWNRQRW